ncbi:hypothetical protein E3N88_24197 [Mikania micrantha]|uniref:Rad21/Rec8-like protein N-terminal domain-containing protein n=1 Tax=Mikania micrantha TaxID=192012 RepID=A0A5N6NFB8_9ASTR|nr:hypothetical protein E3N88_24197 [Mikania micrantha]
MGMISRQLLMGMKNDDLGRLWMAAHFPKRINKQLVEDTNITSSVDKILEDQLPVLVTYRILGYLLLGVARIYSKKVEYLLIDCNHSLNEMKLLSDGRKKLDVNFGGTCLPELSCQGSKLQVADVSFSESSRRKNSYTFIEPMRAQFSSISLPDHFELDVFDLESYHDDSNNINPETSLEKFRHRFVLEDCLDPMVLGESDEELVLDTSPVTEKEPELPLIEHEPEWNNDTNSSDKISDGVKSQEKHPDEECTTTGQTLVSEMALVDNIILKPSPNKSQLSVTINVTPQSKTPVVSGICKSELVAVRTPASREHARAPRKRKYVYDYPIVVPDRVYKTWVSNASDIVRKRRTPADVVKQNEHRFRTWNKHFSSDCFPSDLRSAISTNQLVVVEEVEETVNPPISKNDELEPLNLHKVSEETEAEVIAPPTPATQSTFFRFNESHEASKVNQVGPTSSCESLEKAMFSFRNVDIDEIQREEKSSQLSEVLGVTCTVNLQKE